MMEFNVQQCLTHPLFAPVKRGLAYFAHDDHWPTVMEYQNWLATSAPIPLASGRVLRIVDQLPKAQMQGGQYESHLYLTGGLCTRQASWHDFFNAQVWVRFPRVKARLNALHYQAIAQQSSSIRCARRDALTLFDESGLIVVSRDPVLFALLKQFKWQDLFVTHREKVCRDMRFFVFGHAIYERALTPYLGLTAKAFFVHAQGAFFEKPIDQQLAELDVNVEHALRENLSQFASKHLMPVPVYGIPGWHEGNNDSTFYEEERFFRRSKKREVFAFSI